MKILHISNITFKGGGVNTVLPDEISFENTINNISSELLVTSDIKEIPNSIDFNCYILKKNNIKKLLVEINPDFIVFHLLYVFRYIHIYNIIKKLEIPYLIKPHGGFAKEAQKKSFLKKKIANMIFLNRFVKKSEGIIYLSSDEMETSIYNDKEKNFILPNGVNSINNRLKLKNKLKSNINILFLGRIDINHKGLDYLLKGINLVKNILIKNNIIIDIYGFGKKDDIKYLKRMINKNELGKIVNFKGSVFGEEKIEVLINSDIFILTSRYEGMPMAIIEALSYGLPCIVTKGTNMTQVIKNNNCGWITNLNSRDIGSQIVNSVQEFKSNKEKLIKNSRDAAIKFKWENNIKKYKSEYNKIYNTIY